ncbi:hypothetical protein HYV82_06170 [Candidatus Woesearchaeota archaeon]|nr:hypothetical protein [Candidatus Woesearchaeota archaeon]
MSISGSTVKHRIREQIDELEREEEGLNSDLRGYENQIGTFTGERESIYAVLAANYLPELDAESVKQTVGQVQGDATEKLNAKAAERDELVQKVGEALQQNQEYVQLTGQAAQEEAHISEANATHKAFQASAGRKLAAYEGNRLFMYLAGRKYGTEQYRAWGAFRALDSWVARQISYADARKGYDYLRAMPGLMADRIRELQEGLNSTRSGVQRIEKAAANRHGLTKAINEGTELAKYREQILANIQSAQSEEQAYTRERAEIDGEKDPYHQEAITELKSYLKGETIAGLKALARSTPGTEDDGLVARIESIDESVRALKDNAKESKASRDKLARQISGLREVLSSFTQHDYDSGRSYFGDGFDINALLAGYLMGRHSSSDMWRTVDAEQHFEQPAYSYSGSSGSDSGGFGGFSSGGGFGGGGGGGFSSGGGF